MNNSWRRVDELLASALELPEGERAAYLERACPDSDIRAEVEQLLAAHAQAGDFLQPLTLGPPADFTAGAEPTLAGKRIGPYRLAEEIAHGGMGAVYRAERADQQFQQQVAIKLIAGLSSPEALLRFRAERQILAGLVHPQIARLLDGGVTAEGVPYMVMEYIQGLPITEYCRRQSLPVRERLALFSTICSAVHYAHQRLVVHRDIKPGNILVTEDGQPRLLDFGIAKILSEEDGGPATRLTRMAPMTLDYASPEQLRGRPITTATDIYSLGVLLYELLAGERPYHLAGKPYDEALRLACERDPEKPSAMLRSARQPPPDTPASWAGDLDAIVLKAMRKEPGERYASAEELKNDIARVLAGLPVIARRGTFRYVTRKFVARNKAAVAGAVAAAVLLAAGVAAISWEARVARLERNKAQRRFDDVRGLAHSLIFELHDDIAKLPGSTAARKALVTRALEYLDRLAKDAHEDPALQKEIAAAYLKIGDVQGHPNLANLGDSQAALASYAKARALLESMLARRPGDTEAARSLAALHLSASAIESVSRHNFPEALADAREAERFWQAEVLRVPNDPRARLGLASADYAIGIIFGIQERPEAQQYWQRALEVYEALLEARPDGAEEQRNVAVVSKTLASFFTQQQQPDKALLLLVRARELDEKRATAQPDNAQARLDLSFDLSEIAGAYWQKGDLGQAAEFYGKTLDIRRSLMQADPNDARVRGRVVYACLSLGDVLVKLKDGASARDRYQEAARLAEALLARDPAERANRGYLIRAYAGLGDAEDLLAHRRQACASYGRAMEVFQEIERRGFVHADDRKMAGYVKPRLAAQCH